MRRALAICVVAAFTAGCAGAVAAAAGAATQSGGGIAPDSFDAPPPAPVATGGSPATGGSSTTGGTSATGGSVAENGPSGGSRVGRPFRIPPVIRLFTAAPRTVTWGGPPTRLRFRVDAVNLRTVRLRLLARRAGGGTIRVALGRRRTGRLHTYRWARRGVGAGTYTLRLEVVDFRGRLLSRAARTTLRVKVRPRPAPKPAPGAHGFFPIQGSYSWGDGFGVDRGDHSHNGQDLAAASGTPLVAPRAGTVFATGYGVGSGEYVVIRDATLNRSYVYFHLLRGSTTVGSGQPVRAGQRIGLVGSTGNSTGPHLHFELWVGGWWSGGHAIDPAPTLRSWAR